MNFELIDNLLQIVVLLSAAGVSAVLALLRRSRPFFILALAYACFAMGTLYYVLYLAIIGTVPQVFYVAEISWLASWLFFLSYQILRTPKLRFSWRATICAVLLAVFAGVEHIFGPSAFMIAAFALTAGAVMYFSVFRLQTVRESRKTDGILAASAILQVVLYFVSEFFKDYTHFNAYFAVDIALTLCLTALLPLTLQEVKCRDIH